MKKNILILFSLCLITLFTSAQKISKRLDSLFEKAVNSNSFNGSVLVCKHGKVIYKKAFGDQDADQHVLNTSNTIYQVGSITKEFTAAIILKLAEQHKLSLDDKLSKYIPSYVRGDEITIRHLLTHESGIYDLMKDRKAMQENTKPRSHAGLLSLFIDKPLDFTPGTKYAYSNSGYILLGLIIENIMQKPYQAVVREMILKPLKMKHTGFDLAGLQTDDKATGYAKYTKELHETATPWDSTATFSAGSLYSTVEDLYRWHKGLQRYKVYSKESLELAGTPNLKGYGFGCWIDTLYDKQIVSHSGIVPGFAGYIGRIQEDNSCVILLENVSDPRLEAIGLAIFAVMYHQPSPNPETIQLPVREPVIYTGEREK